MFIVKVFHINKQTLNKIPESLYHMMEDRTGNVYHIMNICINIQSHCEKYFADRTMSNCRRAFELRNPREYFYNI